MRRRGSISVFLAILLPCLLSGIFAFLEAARVSGLKANAAMCTMQAKDAWLSSYCRPLWEQYRILFWEGGDFPRLPEAGRIQKEVISGNWGETNFLQKNFYLYALEPEQIEVNRYQLATDSKGAPFRAQAADAVRKKITGDAAEQILKVLVSGSGQAKEGEAVEKRETDALQMLEDLKQGKADQTPSENTEKKPADLPQQAPENPIDWMKNVKKKGVFAYLMPEEDISVKKIDSSGCVSRRKLLTGNLKGQEREDASEKLFFHLYLGAYFSNAAEKTGERALDYEMEYFIAGKSSDKENLKRTVNRLLLMREAANLVYLEKSPEKQKIALALAGGITAAFGQPELAEPLKHGILAAWAYAESLSDVKILLSGGKVSLIKSEEQWHTSLEHLSASLAENVGEKQKKGLSYGNYLQILLWTQREQKLAYRAMDLIEKDVGVRMDKMVSQADCSYQYRAPALFWKFVRLGNKSVSGYTFQKTERVSYMEKTKSSGKE